MKVLFFLLDGATNASSYTVQASTNLIDWTNIYTTNSPTLPFNWMDTNTGNYKSRFYRAYLNP